MYSVSSSTKTNRMIWLFFWSQNHSFEENYFHNIIIFFFYDLIRFYLFFFFYDLWHIIELKLLIALYSYNIVIILKECNYFFIRFWAKLEMYWFYNNESFFFQLILFSGSALKISCSPIDPMKIEYRWYFKEVSLIVLKEKNQKDIEL